MKKFIFGVTITSLLGFANIVNANEQCSLEALNSNIEERLTTTNSTFADLDNLDKLVGSDNSYKQVTQVRISPELTPSCKLSIDNPYATKKPIYTCAKNVWYNKEQWDTGYKVTSLYRVSQEDFKNLTSLEKEKNQFEQYTDQNGNLFYISKHTEPINKNCWQWEEYTNTVAEQIEVKQSKQNTPIIKELQGSEKLACEAILCLSSSVGRSISECNPSLEHYFSIKAKKMSDTIKKRRDFLKLCPDGGDTEDLVYKDLKENVLPGSDPRKCTVEYLNKQIETQENFSGYNSNNNSGLYSNSYTTYRINPNIPRECQALFNHSYTDLNKPQYICSGEFYSKLEWDLSSTLEAISYKEYKSLPNNSRYSLYDDYSTNYYKLVPFSKTCFVEVE